MAIADIRNTHSPRTDYHDRGCAVCVALKALPESEAAALVRHLSDVNYRYENLSADLARDTDNPLTIDAYTLSRHARGKCGPMRARGEKLRG